MSYPNIYGFNETSDAGTDHFGSSIFLKGCNLKCPYCINSNLVEGKSKKININKILKNIRKNKTIWVFISGGEPTCCEISDLLNLIILLKFEDCKVGLSTNGINVHVLRDIIKLVDYVALDVKGHIDEYEKISIMGGSNCFLRVLSSWNVLREEKAKRNEFNYEIRSTIYPAFILGLMKLCEYFNDGEKWVIQVYRPHKRIIENSKENDILLYNRAESCSIAFHDLVEKRTKAKLELRYV